MTQVAAAPAESRRLSAPGDPEELGALFESYLRLLRVTSTPWRLRLRFCPGLHRIAVEHVRRSTDALLCHFHGRLARGEDPQSEEACERLESLSHSLPAERSGLWPLLPVIAIVVLAEALAPICASAPVIKRVHEMSEVTELDVTHTSAAVNMLLHSSVQAVLFILWVFALSTLIALWPARRALRAFRPLIGLGDAGRNTALADKARELDVREHERRVFEPLEEDLPRVPQLDLLVEGCGVVLLGCMGLDVLWFIIGGYDDGAEERIPDAVVGGFFLAVAAILGTRLYRRFRRRRNDEAR